MLYSKFFHLKPQRQLSQSYKYDEVQHLPLRYSRVEVKSDKIEIPKENACASVFKFYWASVFSLVSEIEGKISPRQVLSHLCSQQSELLQACVPLPCFFELIDLLRLVVSLCWMISPYVSLSCNILKWLLSLHVSCFSSGCEDVSSHCWQAQESRCYRNNHNLNKKKEKLISF